MYTSTEGHVTDKEACLLHHDPVESILNWTKAHLDAYLVMGRSHLGTEHQPRLETACLECLLLEWYQCPEVYSMQ